MDCEGSSDGAGDGDAGERTAEEEGRAREEGGCSDDAEVDCYGGTVYSHPRQLDVLVIDARYCGAQRAEALPVHRRQLDLLALPPRPPLPCVVRDLRCMYMPPGSLKSGHDTWRKSLTASMPRASVPLSSFTSLTKNRRHVARHVQRMLVGMD